MGERGQWRDLCEVRHENQQQHRKGGDDELASHYERDSHERRLQNHLHAVEAVLRFISPENGVSVGC
jgi:hypothetical protein